jgi:tetratricopeptide (TPR) repeat protein
MEDDMKRLGIAVGVLLLVCPLVARAAEDASVLPERELAMVEKLVQARNDYEDLLRRLAEFYGSSGNVYKKELVQTELDAFMRMDKYDYIVPTLDVSGPPSEYIPEAERLFRDGKTYYDYFDLFNKKEKLNMALARFRQVLKDYPTSDKVDDCAFYIGKIYAADGFRDYETAVKFLELAYELNPLTENPARIEALEVYYKRLKDYGRAEALARRMLESPISAEIRKANRILADMRKRGRLSAPPMEEDAAE